MSKRLITGGAPASAWQLETIQEAKRRLLHQQAAAKARAEIGSEVRLPEPEVISPEQAREDAAKEGYAVGWQEGFDKAHSEGYEAGFASGEEAAEIRATQEHEARLRQIEEEARAAHEAELLALREAMSKFTDDCYEELRKWRAEFTETHTHFALEVARRAVAQELHLSKTSALSLAKEALAELHQGTELRIMVNPTEANFLESHRQEILEQFSHVRGLEIVPDRTIEAGVVIEAQSGTIDARIEAYLQRMAESALRGRDAA